MKFYKAPLDTTEVEWSNEISSSSSLFYYVLDIDSLDRKFILPVGRVYIV